MTYTITTAQEISEKKVETTGFTMVPRFDNLAETVSTLNPFPTLLSAEESPDRSVILYVVTYCRRSCECADEFCAATTQQPRLVFNFNFQFTDSHHKERGQIGATKKLMLD